MRLFFTVLFIFAAFCTKLFSQLQVSSIKISTTQVGLSAISVNSITAKTYHLIYPLYDYELDSLSHLLFMTARQGGEINRNSALSRGFFTALNCEKDSVRWLNESSLYNLDVSGKSLLLSNDIRTVKYNKMHGYEEARFDTKLIFTIPKFNKGFRYDKTLPDVLHCVSLSTGLTSWTCTIPAGENWVDSKFLNDSVLIIAAAGIHAVNIKSGLLWSIPLSTSVKTNRSFTYSLAKYNTIQKVSTVTKTTEEQNQVTQVSSNILIHKDRIYFASKEKFIAIDQAGKFIWQVDIKNYPNSKMLISATDTSLILANFGLATHSNNFVTWGKPFIITLHPMTGRIMDQFNLSNVENLADFIQTKNSLIFAGKQGILEAQPGKELKTMLELGAKYGEFVEFINGNDYYTFKEGYYVPLNFLNDNLVYFKADNNKVYGFVGDSLSYEYHFTDLYKLDKKYQDKTILVNTEKTILTSVNFEILFTINLPYTNIIHRDKMYFMAPNMIHQVNLNELK